MTTDVGSASRARGDVDDRTGVLRGLPRMVWVATALFGATMVLWTVAIPTYRAADEYEHVSAALHWSEEGTWPGYKEMRLRSAVEASIPISGLRYDTDPVQIRPRLRVEDATPRPERPSFGELGSGSADAINKAGQHGPGYSVLLGAVERAVPASASWDLQVWVFRMTSVLLLLPVPLLMAAAARRLGAPEPVIVGSAFAALCVPQFAVVGASVNNDNLLNASGAWLALGMACILGGDTDRRTALWVGGAAAVALLSKAWALPLVAVVALCYVVTGARTRRWRAAVAGLATFGAVALLGAWWWVRNLLVHGTLQPAGHLARLDEPLSTGEAVGRAWEQFTDVFALRFWALLGIKYGQVAFPPSVMGLLLIALLACIGVGVLGARRAAVRPSSVAIIVAPTVLTAAILAASVVRLTARTGTAAGIQGRYLYPNLPALLIAAVIGLAVLAGPRRRSAVPVAVGAAGITFTAASVRRAVGYHFGDEAPGAALRVLDDIAAWAPIPHALTFTIMFGWSLSVLLGVAALTAHTVRGRGAPLA